jgi:hypothetical protein
MRASFGIESVISEVEQSSSFHNTSSVSGAISGSINHLERAMLFSVPAAVEESPIPVTRSDEAPLSEDSLSDGEGPSSKRARMSANEHWAFRLLPATISSDIGRACCSHLCTHRLTINGVQIVRTLHAKMTPFDRRASAKADVQSFRVERMVSLFLIYMST